MVVENRPVWIMRCKGMPAEHGACAKVASLMAPVTTTLYGDIFDVRAEPDPINIAYTTIALAPHVDLNYYESPPGIQFLHCLEFPDTIEEDSARSLMHLVQQRDSREKILGRLRRLSRVPATFQKNHMNREVPSQYYYRRPHIDTNDHNDIIAVHWSPPFEGPLHVPFRDVEPYYEAYAAFQKIITDERYMVAFRNVPGDMVCFNQRRMLHGRTAFSLSDATNATRHFQGCYVNIDDYLSKLRVLMVQLREARPWFQIQQRMLEMAIIDD